MEYCSIHFTRQFISGKKIRISTIYIKLLFSSSFINITQIFIVITYNFHTVSHCFPYYLPLPSVSNPLVHVLNDITFVNHALVRLPNTCRICLNFVPVYRSCIGILYSLCLSPFITFTSHEVLWQKHLLSWTFSFQVLRHFKISPKRVCGLFALFFKHKNTDNNPLYI